MLNFFTNKKPKRNVEIKVKESEKMFRVLLEAVPLCIKWFDKDGNLIFINKYGRKEHFLEGKTEEEIKKWKYFDCIDEKYHEKIKNAMKLALEGKENSFEIQHVPGTSEGEWCMSSFAPVKNEKGEIEYVLFLSRDITREKIKEREQRGYIEKAEKTKIALYNILEDIKESEKKAQEERGRSQAIISSVGEGLLLIDKDYKIVLLNNKAENLLGVSASEAIGQDMKDIIKVWKGDTILTEEEQPVIKMFKIGEAISVDLKDDFYYQNSSGSKFPVSLMITPLRGNGITGAVIIFRDISEGKELDEAKSNFISVASHQLRTPLTSIRWYSEMLLSGDAGKLSENQEEFAKEIQVGVTKLAELISTLLALARIESGKTKIEISSIDLKDATTTIMSELDPQIKAKKLNVKMETFGEIPKIKLDLNILRQVITNLISNAIRYTNDGGDVIITIKTDGEARRVIYSVKDNGIGIPESQKKRVFEKFFRADNAFKKVTEGTGLGLNFVKTLVEMWAGEVWFESEENKGSMFVFTIPVSDMAVINNNKKDL